MSQKTEGADSLHKVYMDVAVSCWLEHLQGAELQAMTSRLTRPENRWPVHGNLGSHERAICAVIRG